MKQECQCPVVNWSPTHCFCFLRYQLSPFPVPSSTACWTSPVCPRRPALRVWRFFWGLCSLLGSPRRPDWHNQRSIARRRAGFASSWEKTQGHPRWAYCRDCALKTDGSDSLSLRHHWSYSEDFRWCDQPQNKHLSGQKSTAENHLFDQY